MTNELLLQHPDLSDILRKNPTLSKYVILNKNDTIVESWEKRTDGTWVNTTQIELAKREILEANKEILNLEKKKCN